MNNIDYTAADKREMVSEARSYLRSMDIKPTDSAVLKQIKAEHGRTVADMIAKHLGIVKTVKLHIHDTGRDGKTEIAVECNGSVEIHPYAAADLDNEETLNAKFWQRNGYVGRLEITDGDLQTSYVVNA